jgi:rubrerythrin
MRNFNSLSEREILALAIFLEEEDERVHADFAEGLRKDFPASAAVFEGMRDQESGHRRRLIELFWTPFGEHIPLIRRQDVRGFITRKPVWLVRPLGLESVRKQAAAMEAEIRRFYEKASARAEELGKTGWAQVSRVRRTKPTELIKAPAGCGESLEHIVLGRQFSEGFSA